jgi:hypothetical protein
MAIVKIYQPVLIATGSANGARITGEPGAVVIYDIKEEKMVEANKSIGCLMYQIKQRR